MGGALVNSSLTFCVLFELVAALDSHGLLIGSICRVLPVVRLALSNYPFAFCEAVRGGTVCGSWPSRLVLPGGHRLPVKPACILRLALLAIISCGWLYAYSFSASTISSHSFALLCPLVLWK